MILVDNKEFKKLRKVTPSLETIKKRRALFEAIEKVRKDTGKAGVNNKLTSKHKSTIETPDDVVYLDCHNYKITDFIKELQDVVDIFGSEVLCATEYDEETKDFLLLVYNKP